MNKFVFTAVLPLALVSHFATAQGQNLTVPVQNQNQFKPAVADPNQTQAAPLPGDFGPPGAVQAQQEAAQLQLTQQQQQQQQAALAQQQAMWQAQQKAAAQAKADQKAQQQKLQQLMQMLSGAGANPSALGKGQNGQGIDGNPRTDYGDSGGNGPNGEWGDNQTHYSGQKGAGNIGTGLCTAANANRTQVKNGYCQMLRDAVNKEGSCAKQALDHIMNAAIPNGEGIGGLNEYCPQFGQLGDNRREVFVQVLATLITQESGWNAGTQENEWFKNGHAMGGKGLFQIGPKDSAKGCDCRGINSQTILDPQRNIQCGAFIALSSIAGDRHMGKGSNDNPYPLGKSRGNYSIGLARYFGPIRELQAHKRAAMQKAVAGYCQGNVGAGNPGMKADGKGGQSTVGTGK